MTDKQDLAEQFEKQRPRLTALAQRVLSSRADAEDAVQEAWLRLSRQKHDSIENVDGWLTTVVGRICIDVLRSGARRSEVPVDDEVRDLVITEDVDGPEDESVLADSVGLALLVVLQSLSPDERLAFVLHDSFGVPFADIGRILDKSTDAAKMLASRARRRVRNERTDDVDRRGQRQVVDAFLAAARDGDFDALLNVLAPDVTWRVHTPRGVEERIGADAVLDAVRRGQGTNVVARRVLVNGEPGILASGPTGKPISVMRCEIADGRMVRIVSVLDPRRLAEMDLPRQ